MNDQPPASPSSAQEPRADANAGPAAGGGRPGCTAQAALLLVAFLLAAIVLGFGMLAGTRYVLGRFLGGEATRITQSVVVERTRAVARLVTSETSLRDVVTYENRRLGSTKAAIVIVTGKVLAGVDLETEPVVSIDHDARRVSIDLPPARVLSVEISDLETYDERRGLLNPFRPADRDSIFQLARHQLVEAANSVDVAAHAEESAAQILEGLFAVDGYRVDVRFGGRRATVPADSLAPLR